MEMNQTRETINFIDLLQNVRRYLYVFVLAVVLSGLAGFVVSRFFVTPQYEAGVMLIVNTKTDNTATITNDNITSAQNLVDTYSIIIKSNAVLNQVIERLDLDMTYRDLQDKVDFSAVDNTQIMRVAVRDPDPDLARKIAAEITRVAPDIIVEMVEAGSCKVISQVSVSDGPVAPNVKRNTAVCMAFGLLLATVYVALKTLLQEKHIIDDADVKQYLGLPVIGVIPNVEEEAVR